MAVETLAERDSSLDGTMADLLLRGEMQETMRSIFPRRKDRLLAYGKLVVAPIIRHPVRSTLTGFNDDKGKQIGEEWLKGSMKWAVEGDRCSEEARVQFEAALAIESAFEGMAEA